MKTAILLTLFLGLFALQSSAQKEKIKIKNNIATVDGMDFVEWRRDLASNAVSVHELSSGEEVIFMRWMSYNTSANNDPSTRVSWVEVKFLTAGTVCEIQSRGQKGLVRFLMDNKIIENGTFNAEAADKTVQKYGNNFSANRPESVIIINN